MDEPNAEKQSLAQEDVIPKPECMFCRQEKHDENLKAFPCTYSTTRVICSSSVRSSESRKMSLKRMKDLNPREMAQLNEQYPD